MRKTTIILLAVLATLPAVSIAAPSLGEGAKNKAPQGAPMTHADEKNPVAFCYFEDKAYSEGAVVGGNVCERHDSADAFGRNTEPLYWNNQNPNIMKH